MEGYGTTANLNGLETHLQQEGFPIVHEAEALFDYTAEHLCFSWLILVGFTVAFLALARIALTGIERSEE